MSKAPATVTFEEFVAREREGEGRHEWVGGFVYAMARGSERHDTAVEALRDILGPGARAGGSRATVWFARHRLPTTRIS